MTFEASVGSVDITPEFPPFPSLWMGGYGWVPRGNHGRVARRLRAHCLVLWDDGIAHVLLRADVISVPRDVHGLIRDTLVDEELVTPERFLLNGSHSHSAACLGDTRPDPRLVLNLGPADVDAVNGTTSLTASLLIQLVRDTFDGERTPVSLTYGTTSAPLGFNRAGLPTVLDEVPVVVLRRLSNGRKFCLLFGAACHPVSRGNDDVFDGDYPGAAAERVESEFDVPALFFQGCAGDQDPIEPHLPTRPEALGDLLASAVVDRVNEGDLTPLTGHIQARSTEIDLPFSVDLGDPDVVEELREKYEERRANPETPVTGRHASAILDLIEDDTLPTSIPLPMWAWRFGGLAILGLGHEVLSSYDRKLHRAFGGPLWVMAYTGEVECYVPDDRALREGGYEAGWSGDDNEIAGIDSAAMSYKWPAPLEEGVEQQILDAALKLLNG
ncbi:hypothetical protein [Actinosynnema sp. NPDC020468]|uniref:hypothetical protein n=1 Tax=Actinosynnema sp. NPDC020468 TaxID=3154488 RepID=UPI0033E8D2DB